MANAKKREEVFFKVLMILSLTMIMSILLFIMGTIIYKGLPALNWDMVTKLPGGGFYLGKEGGALNAIIGSVYLILGSLAISLALSVPLVLFVNFYLKQKSILANTIRFAFDILFGVPSIVYGAFGFMLMIYLGIQASLLGGILAISLLIIPILVRSIDEVAAFVPRELIETTQSLGATRYETLKVVVRQLTPGITTAILLAVGRGIGDAATVLFTAGYTDSIPTSLSQPAASLPLAIFFQLSSPIEEVQNRAYAAALILMILILVVSFASRYFNAKLSKSKLK